MHIDEVIRIAESDPDFRWTIESVWQVNEWLKRAKAPTSVLPKDEHKIARLMNLIKSGRIALSSAWGSMHTDFMGEEELSAHWRQGCWRSQGRSAFRDGPVPSRLLFFN
jgi:hypothetical protein